MKPKKISLLFLLTAAQCLAFACEKSFAADNKRPNILLIYADDQSYKTVRCYPESEPWVRTPNIDSLAASGIRFSGAYLGSWCMPSRATLLTGRYPHGIESMRMVGKYPGGTYDPEKSPFWPKIFRQNGYQTAQIGKWHTGTDSGWNRDWDHQIVWNRPRFPENAGNYYDNQQLTIRGVDEMTKGYSTDNYTRWACDYIRGEHRDPNKPWYLWLCYGGVHGPAHPAKRHLGQYKDQPVKTPADIFPPRQDKPSYLNKTQAWARGADGKPVMGKSGEAFGDESGKKAKTHADFVRQVNECVLSIDEGVGQVMAALKESGQLDNTLVIYTADQGFSMGEHGFRTKLGPYDANYRSPLIVRMPSRFPAGKYCPHPVTGADLVVTFFQLAGIELPWKMHGRDISPLLRAPETAAWPHPVFFEHVGHEYGSDVAKLLADGGDAVHNNVPWYIAIRHETYKYVRYLKADEMEEVYDLTADPEELNNLANKPENRSLVEKLRTLAIGELRRTEGTFVDNLPKTALMTSTKSP